MERRQFVGLGLGVAAGVAPLSPAFAAGAAASDAILEAGVQLQQQAMQSGKLTAKALAARYLARI